MADEDRSIELEIEVVGTPEEVWRAIATGPGISSWYVPHTVEEREGGAAMASFGPGPEMQIAGRVAAWEPPRRVVFDGGEGASGLAFEWLVEARDGGTCVVRLVNSGFGSGDDWDGQYDGMSEGWQLFLLNLKLHLEHFRRTNGDGATPDGHVGRATGGDVGCTDGPTRHPRALLSSVTESRPAWTMRQRWRERCSMSPRGGLRSWSTNRHPARRSSPWRETVITSMSPSGRTSTASTAPLPQNVTSRDGRSGFPIVHCQTSKMTTQNKSSANNR